MVALVLLSFDFCYSRFLRIIRVHALRMPLANGGVCNIIINGSHLMLSLPQVSPERILKTRKPRLPAFPWHVTGFRFVDLVRCWLTGSPIFVHGLAVNTSASPHPDHRFLHCFWSSTRNVSAQKDLLFRSYWNWTGLISKWQRTVWSELEAS